MTKIIPRPNKEEIPISGTLNLAICVFSFALGLFSLWKVAHTDSWGTKILWVLIFSFIGNTIFSMLHEAVHHVAHPKRWVNEGIGLLTAAFFPTGFTFQRMCHLGHHRRNRTDYEMFDLYYPRDLWWKKAVQLYGLLFGFFWPLAPIACLLYLFCPWLLQIKWLRDTSAYDVKHTGADPMLSPLFDPASPRLRIRLEMLFTLLFQIGIFYTLHLSIGSWLLCYYAFGFNWGSLQYADHAGAARDIRFGAWNLRVNPFVQYIFLNYHHHAVHHQHPQIPWIHLGKFIDPSDERPSFWSKYWELWRGPKLTVEPPPRDVDPDFAYLIDFGVEKKPHLANS